MKKTCGNCKWWENGTLYGFCDYTIPLFFHGRPCNEDDYGMFDKDTDASGCECWEEKE